MSRAGLQRELREASDGQLQHDLGRRRHVDQRRVLRLRAAGRRRAARGSAPRCAPCTATSRSRWCATAKARRRRSTVNVTGARDDAQARDDRARGDQQLTREDRALRRRSELGPHHRRRRQRARRTRSGERGRSSSAARRGSTAARSRSSREAEAHRELEEASDRDHARPRHRRRRRHRLGLRLLDAITCASTRTTGRDVSATSGSRRRAAR